MVPNLGIVLPTGSLPITPALFSCFLVVPRPPKAEISSDIPAEVGKRLQPFPGALNPPEAEPMQLPVWGIRTLILPHLLRVITNSQKMLPFPLAWGGG